MHVQIADFGLARLSETAGSLNYNFAAPELFGCDNNALSAGKSQKSDVYAFGRLYYEVGNNIRSSNLLSLVIVQIHYNQTPFAGEEDLRNKELVSKGELPPRLDEPPLSDGAWDLIQSCWIKQAADRPAIKEVLERMEAILKMQRNSDRRPLLSLLSILREREVRQFEKARIYLAYKTIARVANYVCGNRNVYRSLLQLVVQGRL